MKFKAGDVIAFKGVQNIKRYIKDVHDRGYFYTIGNDRVYDSSDHIDPFFEDGWSIAE